MINQNIKRRRLDLGLTLEQLGDAVGVTKTTIHRYENGEISNIDTQMIEKLSHVLKCTPAQLVGWETPPLTGNKKLDELITICYTLDTDQLDLIINAVYSFRKAWNVPM